MNIFENKGMKRLTNRPCLRIISTSQIILILLSLTGIAWAGIQTIPPPESSWFLDLNRYSRSAHATLRCTDCHDDMQKGAKTHPDPSKSDFLTRDVRRTYDYSRCQKCHQVAYTRYLKGLHAQALHKETDNAKRQTKLKESENKAPTCGHCHQSHYDRSGMSRVAVGQRMIGVCGSCHREQTVGYLDNIHGRAGVYMENKASAFCTDCHGAHTVVSLHKPKQALAACVRCHPNVEKEFTSYIVHAVKTDSDLTVGEIAAKQKSLVWVNRIKIIAIVVVIFSLMFFFSHSILQILRELHDKLRKH